jgi:hypothetical protein
MNLIARVTAALNSGVDADVFERCAVALMRDIYNNVEPVEGGSDGGRDADIYGPVAGDPDSRGRILVTTGDVLDNLKSSHTTWTKIQDAGETFRVDQLVLVTHAPLSDAKRRNILEYCKKHALPVPQFWTRDWLVEALRRDPEWRVELTGVRGRLSAVSTRTMIDTDEPALVGRADELRELQAATEGPGDTSLVGLPGVGKSRLVSELDGDVHIIEWRAREHLVDDLVATDPAVVVLDDAHLHIDVLEDLVRVRVKEQLSFKIIAVLWPGSEASIESLLTAPTRVQLDRLPRGELDELIRQLGVHGFHARQMVLDQSDGRPGWASVLGQLVVDGNGEDLMSGQYLLDQVAGLARSISGTAALNDALACIAAFGTASIDDLGTVAALTGVGQADLVTWLEGTAQGGMVARTGDSWTVFPALRPLMVAAWFFGEHKTRRWSSVAEYFGQDTRLDRTLLEVAELVPGREALDLADAWFAEVQATGTIDAGLLGLVGTYGQLTEEAADRAAAVARRVLAIPREPITTVFGSTYDPVGNAAVEVLKSVFRRTCSREAARGLLELAIDDDRPRHSHPDHPMRVIQEVTQYLDPDMGPVSELRERILRYTLDWFDEDPAGERWRVLAEVSRHVFDPHVEGTWMDPGSRRKFTIARGLETAQALSKLVVLWDEIDSRVQGVTGSALTHVAVSHFCEIFGVWSSLSFHSASASAGVGTSDEQRAKAREGSERVLHTLASLAERFPAVPIRVNRQLDLVTRWSNGESGLETLPILDDRIALFAGVRELEDDVEEWMARRRREQESLAIELAGLAPAEGLSEFQRLLAEAQVLEGYHGGDGLAGPLAEHVADVQDWLRISVDRGTRSVVGPLLAKARLSRVEVYEAVHLALEKPELRATVLRAFMKETKELDPLAKSVLATLRGSDAMSLDDVWTIDTVTPMLRALLVHPLGEIRAVAAVAFGEGSKYGPALPEDLRADWRAALLDANPDVLPDHSRWRLGQMLEHALQTDPELCADWFIANAEIPGRRYLGRRSVESFSDVIRLLPPEQKTRVCAALPSDTLVSSGFATDLLGSDDGVAAKLLAAGMVDVSVLLRSLSGYRDHTVEGLAPVLLAAGVDPEVIADRTLWARSTVGSVAESIRGDLTFYAELRERRPGLRDVCEAATARLQVELDSAVAKERMDRLEGW